MSDVSDDERLLQQFKDYSNLNNQEDNLYNQDLEQLMSKVDLDQNEATEIFNNMIKGLEQQNQEDIDNLEDSTDCRALKFLKNNKSNKSKGEK